MFSKMIAGLRSEAEKVSGSNYERLLVTLSQKDRGWGYVSQVTGENSAEKMQLGGAFLATGGVVGIMGLAAANQAAGIMVAGASGLAGTSALASISAALAGLGTVTVGATILPVATVVVLGAAVIGIVAMAVGKAMPIDFNKGHVVGRALQNNDVGALNQIGRDNVGISDWLKGAKNLVASSLKNRFSGAELTPSFEKSDLAAAGKSNALNVWNNYHISDLFDYDEGKQKLVDRIGDVALAKFGVVLDPIKTHEALSQSRGNESFSGKVLAVNEKSGLVLLSSGRGGASVHNLRDFANVPEIGKHADISYKQGKMQSGKEQSKERDSALTR